MRSMRYLALAAAMVAGACGGDDSTGPGDGNGGQASFQATISGDLEGTVSGGAKFAEYHDPANGTAFELDLTEQGGTGVIALVRNGARPGTGQHTVADIANGGEPGVGEFFALIWEGDPEEPDALFWSSGGSVTITSSSENQLKGSFQFDCLGSLASDPNTLVSITVSGTFTAKAGTGVLSVNSLSVARK